MVDNKMEAEMNKKMALLLLVLMVIFFGLYLVIPKYEYIDDQTPDLLRFNKVTGSLEVCKDGQHWYKVVSKSVAKVERPSITYDEFMKSREQFQGFLKKSEEMNKN